MEEENNIRTKEPLRTILLKELMEEMETKWRVLIFNPTKEEEQRPEVKLYKEISLARDL